VKLPKCPQKEGSDIGSKDYSDSTTGTGSDTKKINKWVTKKFRKNNI
jgi:hypothetical protein